MSLFVLLLLVHLINGEYLNGTIYYNPSSNNYSVKLNILDDNGIAYGFFNDSLNKTGWSILEIQTNNNQNDNKITDYNRMYAAGYLEGFLSSKEIYWSYYTQWAGMRNDYEPFQKELIEWVNEQREWMNTQFINNPNDIYWQYVKGLTAQFDGQIAGYNDAVVSLWNNQLPLLSNWQFHFITGNADLADVIGAIIINKTLSNEPGFNDIYNEWRKKRRDKMKRYEFDHCSGYVHVTPELDNIFFSHSTWWSYYCTNRVFKHYIFNLDIKYPTIHLSMSSFPGALSSTDDYYQMDSGLVTMETTNSLYNEALLRLLKPQSLFTWQRARIANALSSDSKQWIEFFTKFNSGTYNNQWIILNYGQFIPNQPLKDELLMIAEQIPGNVSWMDVTQELERGYWPSYNIPAIEYIYKTSGAEQEAKISGASSSYDLAPRARIFRRDANNANNMSMVMKLMRYNNYKNDIIEENQPMWAIMSRGDLMSDNPGCFGGIDTKICDYDMMKSMRSLIKNGPTNDDTPTFEWSGNWSNNENCPHVALPSKYDFPWVEMQSTLLKTS